MAPTVPVDQRDPGVVAGADPCRGSSGECVTPLFPLPGGFLFPGQRLSLHIFEPRYRQMVRDLLDSHGRFVMGVVTSEYLEQFQGQVPRPLAAGAPPPPPPNVLPIGGLGEIFRHEALDDGRFLIWIVGVARVHVREAPSDRLYRRVFAQPVDETPCCAERETTLRAEVLKAIRRRQREMEELPDDLPLACLSDILLCSLRLPQSALAPLYCELDVEQRCIGALDEHARRP